MAPVRPSARWRWVAFGYARPPLSISDDGIIIISDEDEDGTWVRLFTGLAPAGFPTEDLARETLRVFGRYWIREGDFERYEIRKMIIFHPRSMRPQHVSELVVL